MDKLEEVLKFNMRRRRKSADLTQDQAAERAKLSLVGFQKIESGVSWPTRASLSDIAEALGCNEVELFLDPERMTVTTVQDEQVDAIIKAVQSRPPPSPLLSRIEALDPAGKAKIEALLKALEQEQARSRIDKELDTPYVGLGVKKPTKSKQSK